MSKQQDTSSVQRKGQGEHNKKRGGKIERFFRFSFRGFSFDDVNRAYCCPTGDIHRQHVEVIKRRQ